MAWWRQYKQLITQEKSTECPKYCVVMNNGPIVFEGFSRDTLGWITSNAIMKCFSRACWTPQLLVPWKYIEMFITWCAFILDDAATNNVESTENLCRYPRCMHNRDVSIRGIWGIWGFRGLEVCGGFWSIRIGSYLGVQGGGVRGGSFIISGLKKVYSWRWFGRRGSWGSWGRGFMCGEESRVKGTLRGVLKGFWGRFRCFEV